MFNGLVELSVAACGLGGVKIAPPNHMAVGCVKVERICDIVEIAKW